jgi:hypothetical protein
MLLTMDEYVNSLLAAVGINVHMPRIEIPTVWSLVFIFTMLLLSMGLSVVISKKEKGSNQ